MPTNRENLEAVLARYITLLADAQTNPRPDYNLDGQEFKWGAYIDKLLSNIERINKLLKVPGIIWLGTEREAINGDS